MSHTEIKKMWIINIMLLCTYQYPRGFQTYIIFQMSIWMSHCCFKFQEANAKFQRWGEI